jgi:hypothetical protein
MKRRRRTARQPPIAPNASARRAESVQGLPTILPSRRPSGCPCEQVLPLQRKTPPEAASAAILWRAGSHDAVDHGSLTSFS